MRKLTEITDGCQSSWKFRYDDAERLVKAENPCGEGLKLDYHGRRSSVTTIESYHDDGLLSPERTIASQTGEYERGTGIPVSMTDMEGVRTEFDYEQGVLLETRRQTVGYVLRDGRIEEGEPELLRETTEYGAYLNAARAKSADDMTTEYAYEEADAESGLTELVSEETVRDADNNIVEHMQYEHDSAGNVTEERDLVQGTVTQMSYDNEGNITRETETDEDGDQVSETFYSTEEGSDGSRTETSRNVTDGVETLVETSFDSAGREVSQVVKTDGQTDSSRTTSYDGLGRMVSQVTVEDGVTTTVALERDGQGRVTREQAVSVSGDESDTVTNEYTYDGCGRETAARNFDGGIESDVFTSYEYADANVFDGAGGLKRVDAAFTVTKTDETGHVTSQTVTDGRGLTVRTKENGIYTEFCYDRYGTAMSSCTYGDSLSNENVQVSLAVTDAKGRVTDMVEGAVLSGDEYALGEDSVVTSCSHDAQGRVISSMDGLGNETRYSYDGKGELASVRMADGSITSYSHEEASRGGVHENRVRTVHPGGRVSLSITDETGNLLETRDTFSNDAEYREDVISTVYGYENGRCVRETESKGNYREYSYDPVSGEIDRISYHDTDQSEPGGNDEGQPETHLAYESLFSHDMNGNVTMQKDYSLEGGSRQLVQAKKMTYDRRGYLSSESTVRGPQEPDAEAFNEQKISYAYDSRGNVTDVDYAFRSGSVSGLRYEYDSDGKVTRVKAKNGLIGHDTVREYEYDSFGRVSRVTDHLDVSGSGSGRLVKEYRYDLLGRLHAIRITDPDTEEVKEASLYHHDKAGNIIKEETVSEYAGNGGTRYTKEYEYDEAGRLTKSIVTDERRTSLVVTNGEDEPVSETRYSYDEAGNLESEVSGATEKTYDHNGLDQLESVAEWDTSDHSLVSYTDYMYDANGNRIRTVSSCCGVFG